MSASVDTLSPSKHMIVVSPFNENDDENNMKKGVVNEQVKEAAEENNGSSTSSNAKNADDETTIQRDEVGLKSCDKALCSSSSSSSAAASSSSSPKVSSSLQQDKERRLQKWKDQHIESLDVSSQGVNKVNKNPHVEIVTISIRCRGRPDIVLSDPFASSPKACLFTLKEGSRYRLRFSFHVSNKAVSGLKYVNTLWKAGVRVDRSEVVLGSFNPKKEPYAYELEEDTAPSGIFVRGLYCARTKVVDDHDNCYLDIKYYFEIQKTWPSCP